MRPPDGREFSMSAGGDGGLKDQLLQRIEVIETELEELKQLVEAMQ